MTGSIAWRPPNWQAPRKPWASSTWSSCRRSARRAGRHPTGFCARPTRRSRPTLYGRSKLAAEDAVRAAGVPFTILRPVLIYGPGVKGNFARLMELGAKTVAAAARPLPQPPIAAGAAKPDRRHSLCGRVTRGERRDLCRGGPRAADFGRDRVGIARGRRAPTGIAAGAAGADRPRRKRARPRRRMAAPGRRLWSPIPPSLYRPDGSLHSIRATALRRSARERAT